jgi:hypothetical protein
MNAQQSVPQRDEIPEKLMREIENTLYGDVFSPLSKRTKKVAFCICQAIESGELKLPSEMGRGEMNFCDAAHHFPLKQDLRFETNRVDIIALRPEEKK